MLRSWVVLLAVVSVAGVVSAAGKDDDDDKGSVEAKHKFVEGNERYARGDYDGAIASFKAAIQADPTLPGPYRNLGLAYRALNRCSDALPMYDKYLELKPDSRFTDRVRREIDLCRARVGMQALPERPRQAGSSGGASHPAQAQAYLHVAANLIGGEATDEASVRVDGLLRGATPLTIPITAGPHRIRLERPGFESADAVVDVPAGQRQEIELTMNKLPEQKSVAATEDLDPGPPKASLRKYGWALLGVAAGFGLMGAGFGIAESALHRDAVALDRATTSRAEIDRLAGDGANYAIGAYVGAAIGGAALAASVILFIVDPSRGLSNQKQKYAATPTGVVVRF